MNYAYTNLAIGAPARLAILRRAAAKHATNPHANPAPVYATWRGHRHATFATATGSAQGSNDGQPVWYWHDDSAPFGREKFADEILALRHTGYYTDGDDCSETARGLVVALPHGRWLAGYYLSSNGERVVFNELHDSERDAAHAADSHAESIGRQESEYQEAWQQARDIADRIEENLTAIRDTWAFRREHGPHGDSNADAIRQWIENIRDDRTELASFKKRGIEL